VTEKAFLSAFFKEEPAVASFSQPSKIFERFPYKRTYEKIDATPRSKPHYYWMPGCDVWCVVDGVGTVSA
jgi:hypothetical protein